MKPPRILFSFAEITPVPPLGPGDVDPATGCVINVADPAFAPHITIYGPNEDAPPEAVPLERVRFVFDGSTNLTFGDGINRLRGGRIETLDESDAVVATSLFRDSLHLAFVSGGCDAGGPWTLSGSAGAPLTEWTGDERLWPVPYETVEKAVGAYPLGVSSFTQPLDRFAYAYAECLTDSFGEIEFSALLAFEVPTGYKAVVAPTAFTTEVFDIVTLEIGGEWDVDLTFNYDVGQWIEQPFSCRVEHTGEGSGDTFPENGYDGEADATKTAILVPPGRTIRARGGDVIKFGVGGRTNTGAPNVRVRLTVSRVSGGVVDPLPSIQVKQGGSAGSFTGAEWEIPFTGFGDVMAYWDADGAPILPPS